MENMQNFRNQYTLRLTFSQMEELISQISVADKLVLLHFLVQELNKEQLSQKEKIRLKLLEVKALTIFDNVSNPSLWQTQIRSEWQ